MTHTLRNDRMHVLSHRTILLYCGILLAALTIAILALTLRPSAMPVPHCQEDEVLTAIDYPYTNSDNLRCLHIDSLTS